MTTADVMPVSALFYNPIFSTVSIVSQECGWVLDHCIVSVIGLDSLNKKNVKWNN
jgi:hypothetical protein